jgi:hypothetical protein
VNHGAIPFQGERRYFARTVVSEVGLGDQPAVLLKGGGNFSRNVSAVKRIGGVAPSEGFQESCEREVSLLLGWERTTLRRIGTRIVAGRIVDSFHGGNVDALFAHLNRRCQNVAERTRTISLQRQLQPGDRARNAGGEPACSIDISFDASVRVEGEHVLAGGGGSGGVEVD